MPALPRCVVRRSVAVIGRQPADAAQAVALQRPLEALPAVDLPVGEVVDAIRPAVLFPDQRVALRAQGRLEVVPAGRRLYAIIAQALAVAQVAADHRGLGRAVLGAVDLPSLAARHRRSLLR